MIAIIIPSLRSKVKRAIIVVYPLRLLSLLVFLLRKEGIIIATMIAIIIPSLRSKVKRAIIVVYPLRLLSLLVSLFRKEGILIATMIAFTYFLLVSLLCF